VVGARRRAVVGQFGSSTLGAPMVRSHCLVPKRQVNRSIKSKPNGYDLADPSVRSYPLGATGASSLATTARPDR
jgi:hypothetical protein